MTYPETLLSLIDDSQQNMEVTANGLFIAMEPAAIFGCNLDTTTGLTFGYYGGWMLISGTPTLIPSDTITLDASDTTYVYVEADGDVVATTSEPSGWPGPLAADSVALWTIVTGTATITTATSHRLGSGTPGAAGAAGAAGESWSVTVNAQTGTTYTLQASDNGVVVTLDNGSAITLTVPSGLGANFACELIQLGAGQVTVTPSSTTVNSYGGLTKLAGQHAAATLVAYVANTFNLTGNLA